MHEEMARDQAFDFHVFHLSNRNETDCCGGQETGRHAHGSPVTNDPTVAQKILNDLQLSPEAFIPATFRIGCTCQRVNDRHNHSIGPYWKCANHSGLQASSTAQIANTT
jgi:hypothetical protein